MTGFTVGDGGGSNRIEEHMFQMSTRKEERKGEKKGKENSYQSLEFTFWEKLAAE